MGKLTPEQRKRNMQAIKPQNTEIEIILRKALWQKGYRYRKNYKALPGSPDIALTKYKIAVFCDGEFFHGKNWEDELLPRLKRGKNPQYWIGKIERNMVRDDEKDKQLLFEGWTAVHFWGEDIKKKPEECVKVIEEIIFSKRIQEDQYDSKLL